MVQEKSEMIFPFSELLYWWVDESVYYLLRHMAIFNGRLTV